MSDYEWGPAEVTYPDWQGTMQIDERMTRPWDLYEFTKIDHDRWTIIGFDWGAGESGVHAPEAIVVPAESSFSGDLRATSILLHEVDPFELLTKMAHVADFRMRTRAVVDSKIVIVDRQDIPEQE